MVNMENMLSSNWSLHIYIPGLQKIQFKNTEKMNGVFCCVN